MDTFWIYFYLSVMNILLAFVVGLNNYKLTKKYNDVKIKYDQSILFLRSIYEFANSENKQEDNNNERG